MSNHIPSSNGPTAEWAAFMGSEHPSPAALIDAFRHSELFHKLSFALLLKGADRSRWNGADDMLAVRILNIFIEDMTRIKESFLCNR